MLFEIRLGLWLGALSLCIWGLVLLGWSTLVLLAIALWLCVLRSGKFENPDVASPSRRIRAFASLQTFFFTLMLSIPPAYVIQFNRAESGSNGWDRDPETQVLFFLPLSALAVLLTMALGDDFRRRKNAARRSERDLLKSTLNEERR